MTPAATRAKVIDMLKAGVLHRVIAKEMGVTDRYVRKMVQLTGLRRNRRPRHDGKVFRSNEGADGTRYDYPKALRPWPSWAKFGIPAAERERLRQAHMARCPFCKGDGYTIVNNVMNACAACAARARVEAG